MINYILKGIIRCTQMMEKPKVRGFLNMKVTDKNGKVKLEKNVDDNNEDLIINGEDKNAK